MRLSPNKVLVGFLSLLLVWGASTWFVANGTKQHLAIALEAIAHSRASSFFEVEVLSHDESFFGSSAEIKVIPVSALLDESLELQHLTLQRRNGPVFINRDGIQFGLTRWEIKAKESAPDVATDSVQSFGTVLVSFSEAVSLNFELPNLIVSKWAFQELAVSGVLDFAKKNYDIEAKITGLLYKHQQLSLRFNDVDFKSKSASSISTSNAHETLMKIALTAKKNEMSLKGRQKKITFNLQSNGSIWANNDTLSGDIQLNANNGESTKLNIAVDAAHSDGLMLDAQLQFRELLAGGFWQALNKQSDVFSLLRQAEWVLEDIETPEQQDFLRSLYLDAEKISRTLLDNPLQSMLIADQTKMAIKAKLSNENGSLSQLTLGGAAGFEAASPKLSLKGLVEIDRKMLSSQALTVLDKWSNRRWFRQYETEFEADVLIRNQKLLLNDFLVSVDGVKAELSQALRDQ